MSLQQLVDYFNDRFSQEHGFNFRPFILQSGSVSGLFGKNSLNSVLAPVRDRQNPNFVVGHKAQLVTTPHFFHQQHSFEIENLLSCEPGQQQITFSSIINFDRLCRTVHLLNWLGIRYRDSFLCLEVDPRHIIGVKEQHGAYFEEIITHCGLQTKNIMISLSASGIHEVHHHELLNGLNNYRELGYKIALSIGHLISADRILNLIRLLSPDFVIVTAPHKNYGSLAPNSTPFVALQRLKEIIAGLGGQVIFQDIKYPEQELCAAQLDFDFVQGAYYEKLSKPNADLLNHKKTKQSYSSVA
jgi:EAL domain-containing protein (putative c-di-GMP-specific phosphodiesterase class I)